MKILILSDFYPPLIGGMERHVQSLSGGLSKRGHQVTVFTTGHRGLPEYEEEGGVKIYRWQGLFQRIPFLYKGRKFHPPARDWLITGKLGEIMERAKADIVHTHGWILYSALPLAETFKIPLVTTLHDYGLFCPKRTLVNKSSICDEPLTKDCIRCVNVGAKLGLARSLAAYYGVKANKNRLKSVDGFIAVSSFVKEVHEKHLGLSDRDIVVIPNFYSPESQNGQAVALPEDFILFVGLLAPHKGTDLLIEAYQKLDTQSKLVMIGGKSQHYSYQSTENILIIENAPHDVVMQAMSRCRFAVFPSIWPEPFGIVVIEAMSQRKAVIASDIGGLKDIVVDGETGILVPPNDSDKLAEAISHLLERPDIASAMGERGYDRFIKNYTPDVVIPKIIEVYESLI